MPWFCMKLSFVFIWLSVMLTMLSQNKACIFPAGICKIYCFEPLFTATGKRAIVALLFLFGFAYLLEYKMAATTFLLFCITAVIISFHESNGIFFRATVLSIIWAAQGMAYAIAYYNKEFDFKKWRVHYSMQMVAAVYTLAAIAKLRASGLEWVNAGPLFSLQVMKNFAINYYSTGDKDYWETGTRYALALLQNKALVRFLLATSLGFELFCFAACFNKKLQVFLGIGLLAMHIGIACIMGIGISIICYPMLIFFFNPLWVVMQAIHKISRVFAGIAA